MGLSPCAEAIRKKRKSAWAFKLFWKQKGLRLREKRGAKERGAKYV